jgi:hypothetical protein
VGFEPTSPVLETSASTRYAIDPCWLCSLHLFGVEEVLISRVICNELPCIECDKIIRNFIRFVCIGCYLCIPSNAIYNQPVRQFGLTSRDGFIRILTEQSIYMGVLTIKVDKPFSECHNILISLSVEQIDVLIVFYEDHHLVFHDA